MDVPTFRKQFSRLEGGKYAELERELAQPSSSVVAPSRLAYDLAGDSDFNSSQLTEDDINNLASSGVSASTGTSATAFGATSDILLSKTDQNLAPCPIDPICTSLVKLPMSAELSRALKEYRKSERRFARYPMSIDFKLVSKRVASFKSHFVEILLGQRKSQFLDVVLDSFKLLGAWKAQANETKLSRISQTQCGYYGWRGSRVIFRTIQSMFRGANSELRQSTTAPQSVTDYIQNVLIPEAALRLIAQDFGLDLDISEQYIRAKSILDDSAEFGSFVHADQADSDNEAEQV
eukprot:jgi/Hompol1/2284/HPOL_005926-RA